MQEASQNGSRIAKSMQMKQVPIVLQKKYYGIRFDKQGKKFYISTAQIKKKQKEMTRESEIDIDRFIAYYYMRSRSSLVENIITQTFRVVGTL